MRYSTAFFSRLIGWRASSAAGLLRPKPMMARCMRAQKKMNRKKCRCDRCHHQPQPQPQPSYFTKDRPHHHHHHQIIAMANHNTSWHDTNRGISLFITIYLGLYLLAVYLSKRLHDSPKVAQYLPEAAMVILIGMIAGGFFHLVANNSAEMAGDVAESVLAFDSSVFFIVLLPPIIFNSGYHLHRQLLLRYFTPICLFAFLGTMISMCLVAGMLYGICSVLAFSPSFNELLAFGALISATDPVSTLAVFSAKKVDPQLFYLLSGESLLNDAVGLVLFEAFAHLIEMESENGDALPLGEEILSVLLDVFLNFGGSLILGVVLGLFAAFLLKKIDLRHTPLLELSAYALIMYAPFVLAEICRLSGIVTVLFTGLAARRYCEPNLSKFTRENSDTIFRLVAHITETVIFLELGLSVITILRHGFDVLFVLSALGACLISRALNIYPLAITFNLVQRLRLGKPPDTKPLMTTTNGSNPSSLGGNDDADEALYTKSDDDSVERVSPLSEQPAVEPLDDAFIPPRTTHFLFLSGLRGAVSYGLVKMFPDNNGNKITFEVTTMLIVLITTFVFGGFTDLALKKLEIPVGVDEDTYMKSLKQSGDATNSTSWWSRFEQKRISPLVLRDFKPAPSDENTGDEFLYQEQAEAEAEAVEMTVEEAAEELSRKKESIYDFGQ